MTSGLQPFLSDAIMALHAPTQAWSGRTGDLGDRTIDGFYHGDTRFIRSLELTYAGAEGEFAAPEWISAAPVSASIVVFDALLRGVDDRWPDPKVRLARERQPLPHQRRHFGGHGFRGPRAVDDGKARFAGSERFGSVATGKPARSWPWSSKT